MLAFATVKSEDFLKACERYKDHNDSVYLRVDKYKADKGGYLYVIGVEEYRDPNLTFSGIKIPLLKDGDPRVFILKPSHIRKIEKLIKKTKSDVLEFGYVFLQKKRRNRIYIKLIPALVVKSGDEELLFEDC
jgi:hypothetical protein